jgi:hypothetical protein
VRWYSASAFLSGVVAKHLLGAGVNRGRNLVADDRAASRTKEDAIVGVYVLGDGAEIEAQAQ